MVEQGTHKPLVASPNLALGTFNPPIEAGFSLGGCAMRSRPNVVEMIWQLHTGRVRSNIWMVAISGRYSGLLPGPEFLLP